MTRSTESGRIMLIRKEFAEDGVLIELYWNVNFIYSICHSISDNVLIELYWNVNMCVEKLPRRENVGINRTILECK